MKQHNNDQGGETKLSCLFWSLVKEVQSRWSPTYTHKPTHRIWIEEEDEAEEEERERERRLFAWKEKMIQIWWSEKVDGNDAVTLNELFWRNICAELMQKIDMRRRGTFRLIASFVRMYLAIHDTERANCSREEEEEAFKVNWKINSNKMVNLFGGNEEVYDEEYEQEELPERMLIRGWAEYKTN